MCIFLSVEALPMRDFRKSPVLTFDYRTFKLPAVIERRWLTWTLNHFEELFAP